MNHDELFKKFIEQTKELYPSTKKFDFEGSKNLISNITVPLQQQTFDQISKFVKLAFKISRSNSIKNNILLKYPEHELFLNSELKNNSVLMSYDFHIENNIAKLIEINTNASSLLIGHGINKIIFNTDNIAHLKKSFETEFSFADTAVKNIAIIDEQPEQQAMYLEFLMYKDLFQSWGYNCNIYDYQDLKIKNNKLVDINGITIDFVYNRFCDFYFDQPESAHLKKSFLKNKCLFSPHPIEYLLLADKKRMIEWQTPTFLNSLQEVERDLLTTTLIPTQKINEFQKEELWSLRKSYFFKPEESFGGKSVYRGKSITKKTFERLFNEKTLVQKFIKAPIFSFDDSDWKYDIRVYCYRDKIDGIVARTYQGQVTNLKTLGGGISAVQITR